MKTKKPNNISRKQQQSQRNWTIPIDFGSGDDEVLFAECNVLWNTWKENVIISKSLGFLFSFFPQESGGDGGGIAFVYISPWINFSGLDRHQSGIIHQF